MGALSSHHVGLVDRRWVVFFLEEVGAADVCELVGFRHRILFFFICKFWLEPGSEALGNSCAAASFVFLC